MRNPFDPEEYDPNDPFSPSIRGDTHAAVAQALEDLGIDAEDDSPFDNPPDYLSFNRDLGRLLYPDTDPDDASSITTGEIGDRLRGLRLDDRHGTPVGVVYVRNYGKTLQVRNDADDADVDLTAKQGTFSGGAKANLLEPYSGEVVEIGGAGKRVKLQRHRPDRRSRPRGLPLRVGQSPRVPHGDDRRSRRRTEDSQHDDPFGKLRGH